MPREPHKRGSQVSQRGLSDGLLCISCAVDEAGNVIGRSVKYGAVSYAGLNALYSKDKIADHSTIVPTAARHTYCLQASVTLNLFRYLLVSIQTVNIIFNVSIAFIHHSWH